MPRPWTNHRVERGISLVLLVGVVLSALVVLAGGVAYLVRHGGEPAEYSVFLGEPDGLRSIPDILRGAAALDERAIIQFGLLMLIATPVVRVAFSAVAMGLRGDRLYAAIAGATLSILLYSLIGRH
jgi:uncharacterized membrane protein